MILFIATWLAQELRPIFTDPSHERGVVEPKVDLIDLTKKKPHSRSGNYRGSRSKGGRSVGNRNGGVRLASKNFRPRKSNNTLRLSCRLCPEPSFGTPLKLIPNSVREQLLLFQARGGQIGGSWR